MTIRDALLAELPRWGVRVDGPIGDDTSLIASGLVDSVGLFEMLLWIEEQTGAMIDPGTVDVRREWDSVGAILRYIEAQRR